MSADPTTFPAFLQAIGVVAMYAIFKDGIPRLLGKKNGEMMSINQHDKECALKLSPIHSKQAEMHEDIKTLLRANGLRPKNGD